MFYLLLIRDINGNSLYLFITLEAFDLFIYLHNFDLFTYANELDLIAIQCLFKPPIKFFTLHVVVDRIELLR